MKKLFLSLIFLSTLLLAEQPVSHKKVDVKTDATNKNISVVISVSNAPPKTSADVKLKLLENINNQANQAASKLPEWTRSKIIGIELWRLVAAFIAILTGYILRKINNYVFLHRKGFFKGKNQIAKNVLDALGKPIGALLSFIGIAIALTIIPVEHVTGLNKIKSHFLIITFAIIITWGLFKLIDVFDAYLKEYVKKTETTLDDHLLPLIRKSLKTLIFIVVFLWSAQTLNYKVSTLVAGLGIGGLAIAFGLQDTLANLFGSIFILFDRPFKIGDRIIVEGIDGIVEEIGMRSTRIRTLSKTLAAIPNRTVASTKIDNLAEMTKRKVAQTIGVTYDTTAEQMERAVAEIKKLISENKDVDKDFILVRFTDFGDSSLNISIIYFTNTTDYQKYLEIKEKINLDIMRKLAELGLSIAFPSRTVYLVNENQVK